MSMFFSRGVRPSVWSRFAALAWIALCLCLLSLPLLTGCGKKGMPKPADSSDSFSWKETEARAVGACLAFTGSFEGAYKNFDGIRLELAAVRGADDCPGCPFVPQEMHELSPKETGFNEAAGTVAFSYCPRTRGAAYRWRLAGMSIFNRLPHAEMTERLLVVDPDAGIAPSAAPAPAEAEADKAPPARSGSKRGTPKSAPVPAGRTVPSPPVPASGGTAP